MDYSLYRLNTYEHVRKEMLTLGAREDLITERLSVTFLSIPSNGFPQDRRTIQLTYERGANDNISLMLVSQERVEKLADTAEIVVRIWRMWYPIIRAALQ